MLLRELVTEVLINPIIRTRTRYFRHAYPHTRDNTIFIFRAGESLLGLLLDSEDSADMFVRNVGWPSPDFAALRAKDNTRHSRRFENIKIQETFHKLYFL
jgi:hypothetical protein